MRAVVVGIAALGLGLSLGCSKSSDEARERAPEKTKLEGQAGTKGTKTKRQLKRLSRGITWFKDDQAAFIEAKRRKAGVLIVFDASWCLPCKEQQKVLASSAVSTAIGSSYVGVRFDVTKSTKLDEARQQRYGAQALPNMLFVDPSNVDPNKLDDIDLKQVTMARFAKAISAKQLLAALPARPGSAGAKAKAKVTPLPWLNNHTAGFAAAKKAKKGVMLDFAAEWCAPCEELDKTFGTHGVREKLLAKFVPVKMDMTKQTKADSALMKQFKVTQLPTVIFLDANGKERKRIGDALKPDKMAKLIDGL